MTTLAGIDVSNWQGASFDWVSYRGKIQFAFIKASEGLNFTDPDFSRNWGQASAEGIVRGAYHFLRPTLPGSAQAHYFLSAVKTYGLGPGDLLMVDVEVADGCTPAEVSACAGEFAATVHAAEAAWPVAYTNQSFAEGGYVASLGECPSFIANPSHVTLANPLGPWHLVSFEQVGQRGVDTDVFYGDLAELAKLAVPHPAPKPPAPAPKVTQAEAEAAVALLGRYFAQGLAAA